jgi:hypothetical protein
MSNEVYAFALKSTLNEIRNACPDVTTTFIFKDRKLLAQDQDTEEETATKTINAFDAITEKADTLGDIETITIQSAEGKVNIATISDFHLTTVSSNEADEKYVNTLTRVLIPIVIKLVDQIPPASAENETVPIAQPEPEPEPEEDEAYDATEEIVDEATDEATEETVDETTDEAEYTENYPSYEPEEETVTAEQEEEPEQAEQPAQEVTYEMLPEPPVTQLIVENLGGLLVPSDTVRIDTEVIAQWNQLYGENKINEVQVEALNGKTTRCKFKPIKKSKNSGKGVIKMPEKIQITLETTAGELVTVKPVVE